jgi:hypothetical protein
VLAVDKADPGGKIERVERGARGHQDGTALFRDLGAWSALGSEGGEAEEDTSFQRLGLDAWLGLPLAVHKAEYGIGHVERVADSMCRASQITDTEAVAGLEQAGEA